MALTVKQIQENINMLMKKAGDRQTSEAEKKASMAEALAYFIELKRVGEEEIHDFSVDNVNLNLERIYNSDALSAVQRQGKLREFASLPPEELNKRLDSLNQDISQCAEEGQGTKKRASTLFKQMDDAWRVGPDSQEYDAAKKAMQDISKTEHATQLDNYMAAETVKKYVAKNLSKANSAAGMTRMAVSLAFLKQTMSKDAFEAYCKNLNGMRGIKSNIDENGIVFDINTPRCIEPDTVGTVKEVYQNFRERFFHYSGGTMQDKKINPRDIAMLTALKNLQAKSKHGENLVVEHEALCAEIEKVQKDKRFINAMKTKSREELIEMAWGGNFDTLDGYTKPMSAVQQERVDADKSRKAQEKAEAEEAAKQKKLEEERKEQEEERKEQERIETQRKLEEEKLKKEQEAQEFRATHRFMRELYEELVPQIQKMGDPLSSVFSVLDDQQAKDTNTELFAKLITLGEYQKKFVEREDRTQDDLAINLKEYGERVDILKNTPSVAQMAEQFCSDPNFSKVIAGYEKIVQEKKRFSERDRKIYPVVDISARLSREYHRVVDKAEKKPELVPVQETYKYFSDNIGKIINGDLSEKQMAAMVAMAAASKELSEQSKDQMNVSVDNDKLLKRSKMLYKDPAVIATAKTLCRPDKQREMQKKFASSREQGKDFIEMASSMYAEAAARKQAEQNKAKGQNEKKMGM